MTDDQRKSMNSPPGLGIFVFDQDLRYVLAQGSALADVGLTPRMLEGKTIWEALPPEVCRAVEPSYRSALGGKATSLQIPLAGRTYTTNVMPVRDAEGVVRGGLVVAEDITSGERLEEQLRENQARYRHLLESSTGYTYTTTYSAEGAAVTTHSPGVIAVTGYTTEDYASNPYLWFEMIDPLDRAAVEEHVARALSGVLVPPLEHRIRHRNGESRWVRNTLVARRDVQTGQTVCDGLIEDVTERHVAQEATAAAKTFLQHVVDTSPSFIFVVDTEGRALFVNRSTAEYYGTTPEALIEQSTVTVHRKTEEAESFVEDNAEVVRTGRRLVKEERNTAPDGSEHWFHTIKVPLTGPNGSVNVLGISTDITERKRAELALRESEERFRTLAEGSSDGIFLADAGGRYQDTNPAAERMLGYSRDEMLSLTISDVVAPEELARIGPEIGRLRKDGVVRSEWRFRRKDGSILLGEVDGHLLSDGRLLGVVRDITKRRQTEAHRREFERHLQDTQRLEALGTLAGGVAHDFNNILAAIFGQLALARMDLEPGHPVHAALADIGEMAERARDLVQQILAFSRPPSDRRRDVQLGHEVEHAVRMLRATLPATVEVRTEIEPELPAIRADASQIHQVIVNLCTNAWHAIGDVPGCITLRLGLEKLDATREHEDPRVREGTFVVMSVSDTGAGMDSETLSRIFEPFFTTKGPKHGTGLGLAVVHGIVRAHGGFVIVRSQLERGSEFRVYLPVSEHESSDRSAARQDTPANGRSERILLLDDEPQVARVSSLLLERMGYQVSTFLSPQLARADFERDPSAYDLVITDMSMPEMDGLAFSRLARAARPDIPIILTSGYSTALSAKGELGVDALVDKPVEPDELARTVRWVLDRRSSRAIASEEHVPA